MKTIKKNLLAIGIILCASLNTLAQPTAKKDRIKFLFSLMNQDSLINKTFNAISSSMASQMKTGLVDSNATKLARTTVEISKENAYRLLNEDMVDIYDKYFTMQDINSFIAFYQSAAGKKMINKLPEITQDIMKTMTEKYQPILQQAIMEKIQHMTADSSAKR